MDESQQISDCRAPAAVIDSQTTIPPLWEKIYSKESNHIQFGPVPANYSFLQLSGPTQNHMDYTPTHTHTTGALSGAG